MSNLDDQKQNETPGKEIPELAPWDATLVQFKLSPHSSFVAKTLSECMIRERFGVTVALIERGNQKIITPGRSDVLWPHDQIYLIGTDDQLKKIQPILQPEEPELKPEHELESIGLESIMLHDGSAYVGKTIRNCGIREVVNGLIVGIERGGQRLLNPDSTEILQARDLLWVVGDRRKIRGMA